MTDDHAVFHAQAGQTNHLSAQRDVRLMSLTPDCRRIAQVRRKCGARAGKQIVGSTVPMDAALEGASPNTRPAPLMEFWKSLVRFGSSFYKFTRPHTMAGTFISIVSVAILALQVHPNFNDKLILLEIVSACVVVES